MMRTAASLLLGLVGCAGLLPLLTSAVLTPQEAQFINTTSAAGAREHLRFYTSIDHVAGTPGDYQTALYTQAQMASYGLDAKIYPFRALINYPISRSLQMTSPVQFTAELSENVYPADPTSDSVWRNRTFHGYGASGDVEAEVVYVNYGSASDFQYLASINVSVVGKIALARYGTIFRGLKVQNAQAYGALACLIYSDPIDDGFTKGTVYSNGPWRPETGVQRGSVQFLSRCSGDPGMIERDPTVCGDYDTADLIPAIPSLPLSYGDALPILQQLVGVPPPASWVGGLNVSYALGSSGSGATVHLVTEMTYAPTTLWNVVATIPGTHPDPNVAKQQIILGNHRDAWVYGSTDPNSGTAALLEIARGLGGLIASGWTPDRTVMLMSWDGEEYGLLGSVNWAESHVGELAEFGVAYLNVDVAVTGSWFSASATPSLANLIESASQDITDPNSGKSLYESWSAQDGGVNVGILGSGSDFASFLHHIGVASVDMSFDGDYGVYHSVYDSFYWTESFGDPEFLYHRAMAQLWGLMALRLAGAKVLPIKFPDTASALVGYLSTIEAAATSAQMPPLDFSALSAAIEGMQAPTAIMECYRQSFVSNPTPNPAALQALNTNLANLERSFIITAGDGFVGGGLPARTWYKHIMQAPGLNTGYAANVFPSLYDAIDDRNATAAQIQIGLISNKLIRVTAVVSAVAPFVPVGCTY